MIDKILEIGAYASMFLVAGLFLSVIIAAAVIAVVVERRNYKFAKACSRVAEEKPNWKADRKCGACEGGHHESCSGWCYCPLGPCDR